MKKIAVIMLAAFVAGGSQASLLNWSGNFVTETDTFSYDGETLEAGWVVRMYQSPAATIPSDWQNLAGMTSVAREALLDNYLHESQIEISSVLGGYVRMQSQALNLTDDIHAFTVLYNSDTVSADAGKALVIGYWDGANEVAVNVGSHDPRVDYKPGYEIPSGVGNIILTGNWQAIPEPATAGLMALVVGLILFIRTRFS